jgi:ferredoxin
MRIVADLSKCIGAGQCVMLAENLFAQDEENGLVVVTKPQPNEAEKEDAERAVFACPTRALRLEDDTGNRID